LEVTVTKVSRKLGLPVLFLSGVLFGSSLTGVALAYQSHMFAARAALNNALAQLNAALPDKAGHRVNAINLVNQAINEVNLGIQAGRM
jgi:hypothetical protein